MGHYSDFYEAAEEAQLIKSFYPADMKVPTKEHTIKHWIARARRAEARLAQVEQAMRVLKNLG